MYHIETRQILIIEGQRNPISAPFRVRIWGIHGRLFVGASSREVNTHSTVLLVRATVRDVAGRDTYTRSPPTRDTRCKFSLFVVV